MPNNPTTLNNAPGVNNATVAGMMHPPAFPLTPPTTPETSDKVTGEVILNSPDGTVTGSCHRLQCLGYIVKIVTDQHDPKGWHLECNRKEDRVRPCNFRRDADGKVTKPLPRRPPLTPTKWRMQKRVGDAAQGPTPCTLAGKSGAVSKQTPESGPRVAKCTFKKDMPDIHVATDSRFLVVYFKGWKDLRYGRVHAGWSGPDPETSGNCQFHTEGPRSSLQDIWQCPKNPLSADQKTRRRRSPPGLQRSCSEAHVRPCAQKLAWQCCGKVQGRV
jgi:hypothetical protein